MNWVDVLSAILLSFGLTLSVIGGLGLHRLPDFYGKLHANGITDTLCALLILLSLALQFGLSLASAKLALIFFFLFFTSPTSSYALGHNAWQWGLKPKTDQTGDDT